MKARAKVFKVLLEHGADAKRSLVLTDRGHTFTLSPLYFVIQSAGFSDSPEELCQAAEVLLSHGADIPVHAPLPGEGSTLHRVIGMRQLQLADLLVEHGADLNEVGPNGKTAREAPQENKNKEMITSGRLRGGAKCRCGS